MITNENWIDFIQKFFGASGTTDWMWHVASGWNHVKEEPGCNCSFTWYSGPIECDTYKNIQQAKLEFTGEIKLEPTEPVNDTVIIGTVIEDEPLAKVLTAFETGPKGITAKHAKFDNDGIDEEPGHGYWEAGDYDHLK